MDEVNECGDSLDMNPQPMARNDVEPSKTDSNEIAEECNDGLTTESNAAHTQTQKKEELTLRQDTVRNFATVMCTSKTREKHILSTRLQEITSKTLQETLPRKSEDILKISQETTPRTRQDKFLSTETQALVKQIQNNGKTYVVKTSELRQGIPEFAPAQNEVPSSIKSHTYRVRKPNRFVDINRQEKCETSSKHEANENFIQDQVKSSRRIQRNQTIVPQNSQIDAKQNPAPRQIHSNENSHNLATTSISNVSTLNTTVSAEVGQNSIQYFDSIETTTSASGSVFYSAPGSSMSSNRPVRESLAECDSLDQSQPDISDSEDLV